MAEDDFLSEEELEELLRETPSPKRSTPVHTWTCPMCAYTVQSTDAFTVDKCPACQDGEPRIWSAPLRSHDDILVTWSVYNA